MSLYSNVLKLARQDSSFKALLTKELRKSASKMPDEKFWSLVKKVPLTDGDFRLKLYSAVESDQELAEFLRTLEDKTDAAAETLRKSWPDPEDIPTELDVLREDFGDAETERNLLRALVYQGASALEALEDTKKADKALAALQGFGAPLDALSVQDYLNYRQLASQRATEASEILKAFSNAQKAFAKRVQENQRQLDDASAKLTDFLKALEAEDVDKTRETSKKVPEALAIFNISARELQKLHGQLEMLEGLLNNKLLSAVRDINQQ